MEQRPMEESEAAGSINLETTSPPQGMPPGQPSPSLKRRLPSLLEEGIAEITRDRRANYERTALWKKRLSMFAKAMKSCHTHSYVSTPALTKEDSVIFEEWTDEMLDEVSRALVDRVEEAYIFLEKLHQLVQGLRDTPKFINTSSNVITSPSS